MAAWPGSLPQAPLLDEYSFEPADQCVTTDMDTGPPQRRRRFSVGFGRHSIAFLLTGTQRAAFDTFYGTTLGGGATVITGFPHPTTGAAATFQFARGSVPQYRVETSAAAAADRLVHVSMVWDQVA